MDPSDPDDTRVFPPESEALTLEQCLQTVTIEGISSTATGSSLICREAVSSTRDDGPGDRGHRVRLGWNIGDRAFELRFGSTSGYGHYVEKPRSGASSRPRGREMPYEATSW